MPFGDLAQALPLAAVALDGSIVEYQRVAADVLTLEPGASHVGAHSLYYRVAFQLGDGADDDDNRPADCQCRCSPAS